MIVLGAQLIAGVGTWVYFLLRLFWSWPSCMPCLGVCALRLRAGRANSAVASCMMCTITALLSLFLHFEHCVFLSSSFPLPYPLVVSGCMGIFILFSYFLDWLFPSSSGIGSHSVYLSLRCCAERRARRRRRLKYKRKSGQGEDGIVSFYFTAAYIDRGM